MKTLKILLIIISCLLTLATAAMRCPSAEVMLPCKCVNFEWQYSINCGGNEYYNLTNVFISLSAALNEDEKHFHKFNFNNTAINELESNIFYDITFDTINIDTASNLTKINTHAFLATNMVVKYFNIWQTPVFGDSSSGSDNTNIFDALNRMINIELIRISDTSLTSIPSNAFTALTKLRIVGIFNHRNFTSIGDNAFYELNNLEELMLDSNPIDRITDHTFSFRNTNTIEMYTYLNQMPNLTANSFSIGAFANMKRPFRLFLQNDLGLKNLDENIFGVVLSGGNRIDVSHVPLECDCGMYWLYENRAKYQNLLVNAVCTSDGKSVFTDRQTFQSCNVS